MENYRSKLRLVTTGIIADVVRSVRTSSDENNSATTATISAVVSPKSIHDLYKMKETIGAGSVGWVRKAIRLSTGQEVAIKTLLSDDCEMKMISKKEYQLVKNLSHPYIVKMIDYHDFSSCGGGVHIVMEYIDGISLEEAVQKIGEIEIDSPLYEIEQCEKLLNIKYEANPDDENDYKKNDITKIQINSNYKQQKELVKLKQLPKMREKKIIETENTLDKKSLKKKDNILSKNDSNLSVNYESDILKKEKLKKIVLTPPRSPYSRHSPKKEKKYVSDFDSISFKTKKKKKNIDDYEYIQYVEDQKQKRQLPQNLKKKRRRMSESQSREIFIQIFDVLLYLKSKQIIHRDLSLKNILYKTSTNTIKILDFNFAIDGDERNVVTPAGTKHFIPPEIYMSANKNIIDQKIDVWCIGICLYYILTSYYPTQAATIRNRIKAINNKILEKKNENLQLWLFDNFGEYEETKNYVHGDNVRVRSYSEDYLVKRDDDLLYNNSTSQESIIKKGRQSYDKNINKLDKNHQNYDKINSIDKSYNIDRKNIQKLDQYYENNLQNNENGVKDERKDDRIEKMNEDRYENRTEVTVKERSKSISYNNINKKKKTSKIVFPYILWKDISIQARDITRWCTQRDPNNRATVRGALSHPWIVYNQNLNPNISPNLSQTYNLNILNHSNNSSINQSIISKNSNSNSSFNILSTLDSNIYEYYEKNDDKNSKFNKTSVTTCSKPNTNSKSDRTFYSDDVTRNDLLSTENSTVNNDNNIITSEKQYKINLQINVDENYYQNKLLRNSNKVIKEIRNKKNNSSNSSSYNPSVSPVSIPHLESKEFFSFAEGNFDVSLWKMRRQNILNKRSENRINKKINETLSRNNSLFNLLSPYASKFDTTPIDNKKKKMTFFDENFFSPPKSFFFFS